MTRVDPKIYVNIDTKKRLSTDDIRELITILGVISNLDLYKQEWSDGTITYLNDELKVTSRLREEFRDVIPMLHCYTWLWSWDGKWFIDVYVERDNDGRVLYYWFTIVRRQNEEELRKCINENEYPCGNCPL